MCPLLQDQSRWIYCRIKDIRRKHKIINAGKTENKIYICLGFTEGIYILISGAATHIKNAGKYIIIPVLIKEIKENK